MSESGSSERRTEQRYCHRAGRPLMWRLEGSGRRRRAWLRNISLSGLSFVSQGARHPKQGQEIDVLYQDARSLGTYRIVRVSKAGRRTAVVACCRDKLVLSPLIAPAQPITDHARATADASTKFQPATNKSTIKPV